MTKRKDLETDIKDYISSTFAKWITEGGIDEGWDAYVAQLDKLGINDLLAVYQQAYDRYKK